VSVSDEDEDSEELSKSRVMLVARMFIDGDHGVAVREAGAELLKVEARAVLEDDAVGSWTASKPVPSSGSCSVPSPSYSFSVLMARMRRVSNAKSIMEDAMALGISHGEKEAPERVCLPIVSNRYT
jgi:hypothetical protein